MVTRKVRLFLGMLVLVFLSLSFFSLDIQNVKASPDAPILLDSYSEGNYSGNDNIKYVHPSSIGQSALGQTFTVPSDNFRGKVSQR